MIYRILKKILTPRYGKKKFQPLFEILYDMSLTGMNIGGGTDPGDSGELNALHYIKGKLDSLKDSGDYTIFDVGANIGKYALLLNDVFGNEAEIHSFEPSLKTYKKLVQNTANKVRGCQYHFGLGDADSRTTLYSNTDESGLASVYKRNLEHFNIDMNQSEEIEIKNLDSFCKEKNINHIHFLKLDVEGHEKKVIEGAKRMIDAGEVDFIQFEFGGCNIDSRTYFQDFYYLLNERYRIYRIVRDGIFPVGKYGERYESFLTTNYLAEKRGL
jgi:FkbM family methyltransferase